MKKAVLLLMALSLPATALAAPTKLAYYTGTKSNTSLQNNAAKIATLATDSYAIDASGAITGSVPANVRSTANANGIALYPVISNFGTSDFDPAIAHAVLKTGTAQTNAINNMVALSQQGGAAGVNLDFEAVTNTDRSLLSAFVRKLANALHAKSRKLIVSVPATSSNDPNDSWTGAFDYSAIGAACDLVQVMTYDQNGPWSLDGPVAGLNWVKAAIGYAETVMPKSKISMGVAAYGYDWNLTDSTGVQVDWKDLPGLIASTGATPAWDTASSSPKFYYQAGGKEHVVWYENARSMKLKAQYAAGENVASVSIWSLGQEDASFWSTLASGGL
ncbi:Spore germination protein YaaH [Sphingomonas gellani]|uniref:Spore germination protein YaaH n=1 Tax=Sphingomonas gellani TaxID=1166340 RepID=A0A1H8B0E0_9SPHN|nr:glycosyl hydrolase family 18 protein [Sphingomonas gellani]SEM75307.1 Spore germination protein YaaH [Sphingomonas gellani]